MNIKLLLFLAPTLFSAIYASARNPLNDNPDSIVGEYLVPDKKNGDSKVRFIRNADSTYDCQVFWLEVPTDPKTGKFWLDERNPDKSKRNVRCDRLFIVRGLGYNAEKKQWDGAKIYDPNRGITARMTGKFLEDGTLEIRGTVLGIGETQRWIKLN